MSSKKVCEYNYSGCQKIAEFQFNKRLGDIIIGKSWSCNNCKQYLEKGKYE